MIIESMKPSSDQLQKKNVYVVKMETTGLDPDDEILELCVIDARNPYKQTPSGREVVPLFHSRFRPEYKSEWPKAQRKKPRDGGKGKVPLGLPEPACAALHALRLPCLLQRRL